MASIHDLTEEQRAELYAEFNEQNKEEATRKTKEKETYKAIVNQTILDCFPVILEISGQLVKTKQDIREMFATVVKMKAELYDTKEGQNTHSFISTDGKYRIHIGHNITDAYDDTANAGIAKVKEFISSLAKDENTKLLVDTVMQLLSKDKKGTLKASRVLQLQQMADKTQDKTFIEGVKIIRDAYRPQESKAFIRAEYKDELGKWVAVPLGITEA